MFKGKDQGFSMIVAIVLVAALGTVGYLAWYIHKTYQVHQQMSLEAAITTNPYEGWQTLKAPDGTFSLRLPAEWGVTKSKNICSTDNLNVLCDIFYKSYKDVPVQITEDRTIVAASGAGLIDTGACNSNNYKIGTVQPIDGYPASYLSVQNSDGVKICQVYEFWVGKTDLKLRHLEYDVSASDGASHIENVSADTFNQIARSVKFN